MARTPNRSRERLLLDTVAYVAEHGVADLGLRQLAAAIGTSHRMLIYHFGSKEGLLIAVIRAVEEEQRRTSAELVLDPSLSPTDVMRLMWQRFADPALWPNERLFIEVYGRALHARPNAGELLDDIVDSWLEPIAARHRRQGVPKSAARAQARLEVAVVRGLLLDLLATGDTAGADDAFEQFVRLYETWLAQHPTTR